LHALTVDGHHEFLARGFVCNFRHLVPSCYCDYRNYKLAGDCDYRN
jgi:hypothetical protein